MLIPMTSTKMCLVLIVMNRETNTKIILREGKVSLVPRCGWSLIAMRTWMDGLCFFLSHICHRIFGFNPCAVLDDREVRLMLHALRNTSCRAFCVATFAVRRRVLEGKSSCCFVSDCVSALGSAKSLLKNVLNFVSLCENRPGTATKYLV